MKAFYSAFLVVNLFCVAINLALLFTHQYDKGMHVALAVLSILVVPVCLKEATKC